MYLNCYIKSDKMKIGKKVFFLISYCLLGEYF